MSALSVCICVLHMQAVTLEARESVRSRETGVGCYPVGSGNPGCLQEPAAHLIVVRIKIDFSSFLCPT